MKINKEFKDLIRPLNEDEFKELESSLIKDGCRDAIVVWKDTIVDGHNRYMICQAKNIKYKTIEKDFKNEDDAKEWIIRNQFGRRNLTDWDKAELALALEPLIRAKAKDKEHKRKTGEDSSNVGQVVDTKKELASISGLSNGTMAKAMTINKSGSQELKDKLKSKSITINKAYKEVKKAEKVSRLLLLYGY